jgi:MoaA/NifB/PqqE/SkfB family radical SAM enzyme
LEEIIACASDMGIWTSVVTNGSLLTPERVVRLKEAGLDNLLVSLDSTWPQVHDQQRGASGLHAQAVECMRWIRSEFLKGHRTGGIMCVISRRNSAHVNEIVDFAHKLGVYVIFQPYHPNKTGNPEYTPEFNEAEARQFLRLMERTRSMLNSRSYLAGIQPFLTQQDRPSCNAGLKYFSIDPFGHLHPCVDMPPVGHILEDDLTALRSEKAQAMVRACRGCWYCFRGEADTSLSLTGCLEKARLGLAVLRRNAAARSHM